MSTKYESKSSKTKGFTFGLFLLSIVKHNMYPVIKGPGYTFKGCWRISYQYHFMTKSNIYVYIELSKLINELNTESSDKLKQKLKAKSAYFNIIESRYFSDLLVQDWESIVNVAKQKEAVDSLSTQDCVVLVKKIRALHQKVEAEING